MKEEEKVEWEMTFWFNGQKQCEIPWMNGQLHGIETCWNENGSLRYIEKWNQGQVVVGFEFKISEVPEGKVPEVNILTNEFKLL